MSRQFSIAIVGADFPNRDGGNRRTEIAFCDPGEVIELRPEPNNPHDEHAIAVYSCRGFQIGYVSSQRAVFLKSLFRAGRELLAIFQSISHYGAVVRVGVDVRPTLPLAADDDETQAETGQDRDDGFYPDPDPGFE